MVLHREGARMVAKLELEDPNVRHWEKREEWREQQKVWFSNNECNVFFCLFLSFGLLWWFQFVGFGLLGSVGC